MNVFAPDEPEDFGERHHSCSGQGNVVRVSVAEGHHVESARSISGCQVIGAGLADAGRDGAPQIVALDFKPVPEKLEHWAQLGVTEVLFGLISRTQADRTTLTEALVEEEARA